MSDRQTIENYHIFLSAKLALYEKAVLTKDLEQEAKDMIDKGIVGVKTELKFVNFHLSQLAPEVVPDDVELGITRSVK